MPFFGLPSMVLSGVNIKLESSNCQLGHEVACRMTGPFWYIASILVLEYEAVPNLPLLRCGRTTYGTFGKLS